MLGIFFSAKSAVLIEDVPFTEADIRDEWVIMNSGSSSFTAENKFDELINMRCFYSLLDSNRARVVNQIWACHIHQPTGTHKQLLVSWMMSNSSATVLIIKYLCSNNTKIFICSSYKPLFWCFSLSLGVEGVTDIRCCNCLFFSPAVKILLRTSTICTPRLASTASSLLPSTWWWAQCHSARSDSTNGRSTWSHKQLQLYLTSDLWHQQFTASNNLQSAADFTQSHFNLSLGLSDWLMWSGGHQSYLFER